ncbi:hypothetical protein [Nonomuraea rhodomycinica]|uniref:hypothetical protein n=1 Tax=Nonomuraea rhodomycinica TaxID=1712872 RepID=UPI001C37AD83|nr:hypothetical protein [Nonomuraea rhodomycinica]
MASSFEPRSSAEIRAHLRARLNAALRRSSAYGGEIVLRVLLDHLTYAEGQEEVWAAELRTLRSRGAFDACGVTGAFRTVLADSCDHGVASLYAESRVIAAG